MACCLVGSLLMVLVAGLLRWLRGWLPGAGAQAPERWRLHADPCTPPSAQAGAKAAARPARHRRKLPARVGSAL